MSIFSSTSETNGNVGIEFSQRMFPNVKRVKQNSLFLLFRVAPLEEKRKNNHVENLWVVNQNKLKRKFKLLI